MRISDWSSDVCSSDLDRQCLHGLWAMSVEIERGVMAVGVFGNSQLRDLQCAIHAVRAQHQMGQRVLVDARLRLTDLAPAQRVVAVGTEADRRIERSEERRVGQEGDDTCSTRWRA